MTPAAGEAKLLDVLALKPEHWKKILDWGVNYGWVTPCTAYEISWKTDELDEEGPGTHYMTFESELDALDEAQCRDTQPTMIESYLATKKLIERLGYKPDLGLTQDLLMTLYAEDVLWEKEGIQGAWWDEELNEERLSAPRGVIHQQAQVHWIATEAVAQDKLRPRGPN